ncbi:hypothetical protein [Lysobacter humi (ex Lee et al. 2017)]
MRMSRAVLPVLLLMPLLAGCGRRDDDKATDSATPAADAGPIVAPSGPPLAPAVTGDSAAGPVDVRPLASQGEAGVQALLGAPSGCADVAGGRRCTYPRGNSEITFIDGMADHIVIADLGGAPFEPATISRIGLAGAEPLEVGEDAIRWQNVAGMREIVLERGADGRAGRIVIKTLTP